MLFLIIAVSVFVFFFLVAFIRVVPEKLFTQEEGNFFFFLADISESILVFIVRKPDPFPFLHFLTCTWLAACHALGGSFSAGYLRAPLSSLHNVFILPDALATCTGQQFFCNIVPAYAPSAKVMVRSDLILQLHSC